ncbi:hypothetical protein M5K25_011067 [Dendrobium thyrsiflorum]|uniref:Uncharacterized protein n=1 Tax=Dendrobium thyrsiflorum TaxID=117978 RepID=A0ABD0V223_DENTH
MKSIHGDGRERNRRSEISAQHLWRLSSEYVNIVSGSLPSPGSGEKGNRFSAFTERLEKEWFSAFAETLEGRAVLCWRKKGSLPLPEGRSWIVQDDMNKDVNSVYENNLCPSSLEAFEGSTSTLCRVLCPHRGVVKKDIGSLPEKEEWIGSLPEKEDIGSLPEKEEWIGSLPEKEDIGSLPEKEEWSGSLPEKEDIGSLPEKEEYSGSLPESLPIISGGFRGEYVNILSGSLPSLGSGEKGYRFSAGEGRVDRFSAGEGRHRFSAGEGRVDRFSEEGRYRFSAEKEEWSGSLPEKEDIGSLPEKEEYSGSLSEGLFDCLKKECSNVETNSEYKPGFVNDLLLNLFRKKMVETDYRILT